MIMDIRLAKIANGLDKAQKNLIVQLKTGMAMDSVFDTLNNKDLIHVLDQDIECRAHLKPLSQYISNIEVSDISYAAFLECSKDITAKIASCGISGPSVDPLILVNNVINSEGRLDPMDIFTVISIMINSVSECFSVLPLDARQFLLPKLDTLLEIKQRQLSLLDQYARFHSDFAPDR